MTTQVFRRASAAYAAAGDRPIIRIGLNGETLFIVGDLERLDSIELLTPVSGSVTGRRQVAGQVSLGHLARLGNANGAAARKGEGGALSSAFPGFGALGGLVGWSFDPDAGTCERVRPVTVAPSADDLAREDGFPPAGA